MAFLGLMPIYRPFMDWQPIPIFPKFWNLVLCFIIKNTSILCLTSFSNTSKIRIYELKFFKLQQFRYFSMILQVDF